MVERSEVAQAGCGQERAARSDGVPTLTGVPRVTRVVGSLLIMVTCLTVAANGGTRASAATQEPYDILSAAGDACVAAYSSVRALYSSYGGPLYQVQRASDGQSTDIGLLAAGGYANAAAQDSFCAGTVCTVTKIYDQSPQHNDLTIGVVGTAGSGDLGVRADSLPITAGGNKAYGLLFTAGTGYRRMVGSGVATNGQPESIYAVTKSWFGPAIMGLLVIAFGFLGSGGIRSMFGGRITNAVVQAGSRVSHPGPVPEAVPAQGTGLPAAHRPDLPAGAGADRRRRQGHAAGAVRPDRLFRDAVALRHPAHRRRGGDRAAASGRVGPGGRESRRSSNSVTGKFRPEGLQKLLQNNGITHGRVPARAGRQHRRRRLRRGDPRRLRDRRASTPRSRPRCCWRAATSPTS